MKPFPVVSFLTYVRGFQDMFHDKAPDNSPYTASSKEADSKALQEFAKEAVEYSLLSTADQFIRMSRQTLELSATRKQINDMVPELLNRLEDECRRQLMIMIDPTHISYISNPQFFDPEDAAANKVSVQFPSAAEDIAEAGKCFALGRSTASVMHLNRAVEAGLIALATALGVTRQNDWGKYLTGIDNALQAKLKASGARSPDEQFYAEVHITFDAVRRAWRNPTMHVDKTYTMERAEEIIFAVRGFMRHLATKLHD
jgi:hypothetical protein